MPGQDSPSRVSVIIATYNRSELLRLTVDSVLAQTYPNVEIIVVDDGSTDNTAEVMALYAGRIIYIRRETNSGGRGNLELGLQHATGAYINFLDHDDLFMPTKLERQVRVLDSRPEIGLVHCGYYHIDKDGNRLEKVTFLPDGALRELLLANPMWSGAPLIRRECLDEPGLFDDPIWYSDYGRLLRIALAGYQFACVQEPLGAYRILANSQMANVAGIEHLVISLLDKVFAEPQLPADVVAVKDQAYANTHFWVSCRYYEAGQWEAAQRNMAEAIALRPSLLKKPEDFLQHLSFEALSARRTADPVRFVKGLFDHLPACAESLRSYRLHLLGRAHAGLAFQDYARGNIAEAKHQLAEGIKVHAAMLEQTDGFAELLANSALRLPVSKPLDFVDTVLQNLPVGAQRLASVRSRVLSDVRVACAFEDYYAGRRRLVVPQILIALRHRPSWLGNRGVVSIFLKSLPAMLGGEHSREYQND